MKEIKWNKLGNCLTNFIFENLMNHRIGSLIYILISRLETLGKGNSSSCYDINSEIYDKINGFFFNIMKHKQWTVLKASSDWLRKL